MEMAGFENNRLKNLAGFAARHDSQTHRTQGFHGWHGLLFKIGSNCYLDLKKQKNYIFQF